MSNATRTRPLIVVIAGHGGADTGAINTDAEGSPKEADVNLDVAAVLSGMLSETYDVMCLRQFDMTLTLNERVAICNILNPALVISIHCNSFSSPGPNGIEVFTSPGQTKSDDAADKIIANLMKTFTDSNFRADLTDGDYDKEAHFQVLTGTNAPAVLVELGFMSNLEDLTNLMNCNYQNAIAASIAKGVMEFVG